MNSSVVEDSERGKDSRRRCVRLEDKAEGVTAGVVFRNNGGSSGEPCASSVAFSVVIRDVDSIIKRFE